MSPEEIERRRKEHFDLVEKRKVLFEKAFAAANDGDIGLELKLTLEVLGPDKCEHGHLFLENCMACDEIHKEVFPELYATCTTCKFLTSDDLDDKGNCWDCQYDGIEE